ncbi:MAG: hypothetical protein WC887_01940 [Candidatus Paceibacterota bacterium]|jgi:hypothetical protein
MGRILENLRVPIAVIFSVVLIVGAYVIARSVESPSVAQASTETELLQAIATKDSDTDGLTDWEEALYGTSPTNSDSFSLGMTDGEAVAKGLIVPKAIADISVATSSPYSLSSDGLPPASPEGTLTATFATNLFSLYLEAKQANGGADLSEAELSDISNQALNSLSANISTTPDFKSANNITVSGSGADALKVFAVNAEAVLAKNTNDASKSEILYLQDVVQNDDTTALPHIASIAKSYRDSAAGLAALPVPEELSTDDLALINAMARMGEVVTDFARVDTDPLAAMLALKQYPQTVVNLSNSFARINTIYKNADISLSAGTPGAFFVNLIENAAKKQAATDTKYE